MEDLLISCGDPVALDVDYQFGGAKIYTEPTDKPILELFEDKFSKLDNVTVALSGGLDSQFSANLAKKFTKNPNAVTFKFLWEGNVVNPTDVCHAIEFANKIDLDLTIEEIDLQKIFQYELENLLLHYRSISPQISAQVYAIKNSQFKDNTFLLGGEIPTVFITEGEVSHFQPTVSTFHFTNTAPFILLESLNGMHVIRDPFFMSPEIMYQALMHNATVIKKNSKCMFARSDAKTNTFAWKRLFYNEFEDFVYINPLSKRTGFESLKFHFASETGNYDQFDVLYRNTLWKKVVDMPWATPNIIPTGSTYPAISTKHKATKLSNRKLLQDNINKEIKGLNLKECNTYTFDW